ncbi:hypothetical protein EDD16DRAFT_1516363 [Pisolithus croceorrhizus]|nr:hypothetical protein EDD16DRAFT_1516363 [Pisolithus croceorrhizus]
MSHTDRPAREAGERQNYSKGAFSPGGDIQGLISLYAKAEGEGAHKDKLHSSDSPGQEMTVQKSQAVQLTSELGGDIRVLQSCDEPRGGVWDWDRPLRGVVDNGEWGRWYWEFLTEKSELLLKLRHGVSSGWGEGWVGGGFGGEVVAHVGECSKLEAVHFLGTSGNWQLVRTGHKLVCDWF